MRFVWLGLVGCSGGGDGGGLFGNGDDDDTVPGPGDDDDDDAIPVDVDGDGFDAGEDCNDADPRIHPGAAEIQDGVDNDCDAGTCTATGFAAEPTPWALPAAYGGPRDLPFYSTSTTAYCDTNTPYSTTMDLTGDGTPDLVVTGDPCWEGEIGDTKWLVYEGGTGGFAETPTDWALPAEYGGPRDLPFYSTFTTAYCDTNTPYSTVMDLSGDGTPDLVVTGDPCWEGEVGDTKWLVYEGGPGGFAAEPTDWALPAAYGGPRDLPFYTTFTTAYCDSNTPYSTTMDLTGDGTPDLVVTGDPCWEGEIGDTKWLVYPGGPGGFAADPIDWALPAEYGGPRDLPFYSTFTTAYCDSNTPYSTVMDLSGDGVPDLVVTGDPCWEGAVGDTKWLVYEGGPDGFAAEPTDWALPAEYGGARDLPFYSTFTTAYCDSNTPYSVTMDLTSDGTPDLVVTGDPCWEGPVGDTEWLVYPGGPGGFATEPTDWALPAEYGGARDLPFYATSTTAYCDSNTPYSSMFDLTGDGTRDLVVTGDPCWEGPVGDTRWLVHEGLCEE